MPRMHQLWIVEDVIRDIMSYCAPRDICRLGMTCHCLFQIYLDMLFGELDSLRPLYGVLPDLLGAQGAAPTGLKALMNRHASKSSKSPRTYSVGRITMYTARIRSLTIGQGGADDAHRINNLRSLLGPLPLQTCFPQLQSLHVIADDPNTVAGSIPLALPTLRDFDLTINFEDRKTDPAVKGAYESSGLPAYIRHLRALPRLDNLSITCANTSRRRISEVEAHGLLYLCRQFPRLRSLDLTNLVMTDALIYQFSKMPMLERLNVCLPNGKEYDLPNAPLSFPSLRHLTIDCESSTELSWFMHSLQARGLQSLRLHIQDIAFCPQTAQKFCELLGAKFRGLTAFSLHPWTADGVERAWTFASFRGLLNCHALERFDISLPSHVIATDDDLHVMLKSWPRLVALELGRTQSASNYECVTIGGLAALAWEASNLRAVRLAVLPALSKDRATSLLRMPKSPSQVEELSLHDLPPTLPSAAFIDGIALVLHQLFPRIQSFTCSPRPSIPASRKGSVSTGHVERGYPLSTRDIASAIQRAYRP